MLTNALDGSEDHKGFWEELNMGHRRTQIIEETCRECEAGRLQWSFEVVYWCIDAFEQPGFLDCCEDGQEDEGDVGEPMELGDRPWRDTDGPSGAEGPPTPGPRSQPNEALRGAGRLPIRSHALRAILFKIISSLGPATQKSVAVGDEEHIPRGMAEHAAKPVLHMNAFSASL